MRNIRIAALTITLALWLICYATAGEAPTSVRLCAEDEDSYPWLLTETPGLNILMLQQVEKQLGIKLDIQRMPWKRCMEEVRTGRFDGLFKISFKPERTALGHYPMSGDHPDASKRMLDESYSLFRLKGSKVNWDGKALQNVNGNIGAQPGFSIIDQLKGLGAKVDDGTRGADANLQKLLMGRVVAVALQTQEAEIRIAAKKEYANMIERVGPPLAEKPYFLMLSKPFVDQNAEFAKQIWNTIAKVRESAEYKRIAQTFKVKD